VKDTKYSQEWAVAIIQLPALAQGEIPVGNPQHGTFWVHVALSLRHVKHRQLVEDAHDRRVVRVVLVCVRAGARSWQTYTEG
jgi:hypothetical protein